VIRFQLDKNSPVPFYRQIVDTVLTGVSAGRITPGEKLPTIRDLAVRLEVHPNTVVKAYSQLQLLGALDTQQGSGVFVKPSPRPRLSAKELARARESLCQEFVSRAQLLGINIDGLIAELVKMNAK
jgi:GntR family transcriptional regulator